jgi:hypothetical protein
MLALSPYKQILAVTGHDHFLLHLLQLIIRDYPTNQCY